MNEPILLSIVGSFLIVLAFLSIVIPAIPGGTVLSYLSILLWYWGIPEDTESYNNFSTVFLVVLGGLHVLAIVGDFLILVIGGKFFHFSKYGIGGALIGTVIGIFFFPPLGIILGGIIGTFVGEFYNDNNLRRSLRITGYSTLLTLGTFLIKIVLVIITAFYFIAAIGDYFF